MTDAVAEGRLAFHPVDFYKTHKDQVEQSKPYIVQYGKERLPKYMQASGGCSCGVGPACPALWSHDSLVDVLPASACKGRQVAMCWVCRGLTGMPTAPCCCVSVLAVMLCSTLRTS